mgnify:CR=1 FL=1|tara:strand:+ start:73184 stop:74134 length:951 start_codon:yes stop_codon:yes gene_type:complete
MKNLSILILLISTFCYSQDTEIQPFLPEIITQFPNVRDISISNSENEVYFSVQSYLSKLSAIVVIKKENGSWSKPEVATFSGQFNDIEPFLSPNGLKLYFASNRPLNSSEIKTKDFDIWFVERSNVKTKWSEPKNIGVPINTDGNEFYPAVTNNNNLYFTSDAPTSKGKDDIFLSTYENGKYSTPISLNSAINSEGYEFNAFVSPDESFIIFSGYNRKDGFGSADLYISFKNEDEIWEEAKNLGSSINSDKMDYCPFVNLSTNTLYFTSKRNTTKVKFQSKQTLNSILDEMNNYENGLSRLYKTQFHKNNFVLPKQ